MCSLFEKSNGSKCEMIFFVSQFYDMYIFRINATFDETSQHLYNDLVLQMIRSYFNC